MAGGFSFLERPQMLLERARFSGLLSRPRDSRSLSLDTAVSGRLSFLSLVAASSMYLGL